MPKRKRPPVLKGNTYKLRTDCGNLFLRVNKDGGDVIEIMAQMGKSGNCANAWLEALCLVWSEAFKFEGITIDEKKDLAKQIIGIHCPSVFMFEGKKYKSCLDLVGQKILEELEAGEKK